MAIDVSTVGCRYLLGDKEVLDNIVELIKKGTPKQCWPEYIDRLNDFVAAGIGWDPDEVRGYFKAKLRNK